MIDPAATPPPRPDQGSDPGPESLPVRPPTGEAQGSSAAEADQRPAATLPGSHRPRPAGEPEPIYPVELQASQAHRAPPIPGSERERWRLAQRLGMAAMSLVITAFFAVVGVGSFAGGDLLQGLMAFLGALLAGWVGVLTWRKG
ncbi:MAG: hypothetical protein H6Q36_563 [Chloroflexi bacterium]|nr:hypothetical protein [Chloroflexota bacterium]